MRAHVLVITWLALSSLSAWAGEPPQTEVAVGPPAVGTLRVVSWPLDAKVEITGGEEEEAVSGKAPLKRELPVGPVHVTVSLDGHAPWSTSVDITAGEETKVSACLNPTDQLVRCERLIDVGAAPKSVFIDSDNRRVWVALLNGPPSVEVYDLKTGERLAQLTLAKNGGVEIEKSQDGKLFYVSQMETHRVYTIDAESYKLLGYYDTEGTWPKIVKRSADGESLYIANWITHDVSVLDLNTGLVRRIHTVPTPRGLWPTPDGKYLYVAGFGGGHIAKIDLAKKKSKTLFSKGKAVRHIVADLESKTLYFSDLGKNKIYTLDLETDEVSDFSPTNQKPNTIDLSPDGKILFVSCRGKNGETYLRKGPEWGSILLYDTSNKKILDAIVGGNQPTGLDVSDDGHTLVTSDLLDNRIRVYSVPSYEELAKGGGGRAESHRADLTKK